MSDLRGTRIALSPKVRESIVGLLNTTVVHLIDLGNQTKLAHWNVTGPHFIAYHELFDDVAEHIVEATDTAAERARTLGGHVTASIQRIAETSTLPPWSLDERRDATVIRLLAERIGQVANQVRAAIDTAAELGDADTADLFTEISRQLDKDLWFLEAHLPE